MTEHKSTQDHATAIDDMRRLLRAALPSMAEIEPRRDLWLLMLRRLDGAAASVPWWDWVLLGSAIAAICIFPNVLPALLFHL